METGGQVVAANRRNKNSDASQGKLPLTFFLLVFALSAPFWLFGGKKKLPLPVNLPAGALVAFVPMIAAAILAYRQSGQNGVKALFRRVVDFRRTRNKIWYLPALLLLPLIYFLSYVVMRLTGLPLPDRVEVPLLRAPAFLVMYFIGGAGEELGWMGYAIDPLQNRWGALRAGLISGFLYALWHAIPFVQTGNPAGWLVWQTLGEFPLRILYVWIYNNTGQSVFAAILFHVTANMSWSLFPNYGSHYNPLVTGIITLIVAVIAIVGWGARTLSQPRFGKAAAQP